MIEDKQLIWKFKSGNKDALTRIYEKYKNNPLRMATGLLNQKSIAEDIVHDVFITLVKSPDRLKLNGNLKSYLATCVINRVRNINKESQRKHT